MDLAAVQASIPGRGVHTFPMAFSENHGNAQVSRLSTSHKAPLPFLHSPQSQIPPRFMATAVNLVNTKVSIRNGYPISPVVRSAGLNAYSAIKQYTRPTAAAFLLSRSTLSAGLGISKDVLQKEHKQSIIAGKIKLHYKDLVLTISWQPQSRAYPLLIQQHN